ncbi:carbon-phosphorus lyase complex subunit PhnI [Enemella sp. A6]|uniref:carbon-phosphorus lyase complex subunit PhnI n=1 Tax=Enemella sp. A6 TaxID=3440152 RepID=UPI003EBD2566
MYATQVSGAAVTASKLARSAHTTSVQGVGGLTGLIEQVCGEAGVWAPDAAERAIAQAAGDPAQAVALVRVWASTLPHAPSHTIDDSDVHVVRRLTSAFAEVPAGTWLGLAPEVGGRILEWGDETVAATHGAADVTSTPGVNGFDTSPGRDAPSRSATPRVRDLLTGVRLQSPPESEPGKDPASAALSAPFGRSTRLAMMARGDTGALCALAVQVLAHRREAVLLELVVAEVDIRLEHPTTGDAAVVQTVPVVSAEIVLDAEVEGSAGLAVGTGISLGTTERRALAIALLDGAMVADGQLHTTFTLDEQTVVATSDGAATIGFIEHLRLPHHASFASYLAQAGEPTGEEQP